MSTMKFTDQLRKQFAESGISQKELSEATGIDKTSVSRFVSGERLFSPNNLDKVADYLGWVVTSQKKKGK
jgi:transcriptional regulator with XRE-family HTH domain